MIAEQLAASSALVWGTADYCGGRASRRANPFHVAVGVELAGLPALALGWLFITPGAARLADLGWGAVAGIAGFTGLVLFYRGLAGGAMSVVAPVAATTSAVLPFVVGLAIDGLPGTAPMIGAGLAIVAIGMVSVGPGDAAAQGRDTPRRTLGLALAAGALFGLFFVGLRQASPGAGLWPILALRVAALVVAAALLLRRRELLRLDRVSAAWTTVGGVFDVGANVLYLLAVREGTLSLVAPIAALYPVSTVLLALVLDRERMRTVQVAGLALAAAALVLIAS